NYEASKVASRLLLADPNDSAAAAVKADATRALTAMNEKNVAAAETRANASGATDADRLALANAYYDAGSYRSAADVYSRLPDNSLDRDTRLRYARSLAWSSELDPAERVYSRLIKDQRTPDLDLEYGTL